MAAKIAGDTMVAATEKKVGDHKFHFYFLNSHKKPEFDFRSDKKKITVMQQFKRVSTIVLQLQKHSLCILDILKLMMTCTRDGKVLLFLSFSFNLFLYSHCFFLSTESRIKLKKCYQAEPDGNLPLF